MKTPFIKSIVQLADNGSLPDALCRAGIRSLCAQRLRDITQGSTADNEARVQAFVDQMKQGPIAPVPEKANEQHYEVPPAFFGLVLGSQFKYSSCYFPEGTTSLDDAESIALYKTCENADLQDGQRVLELGCGWGSLTLWMAERYPNAEITAVSNSAPQRQYIEAVAAHRQLRNMRVITADMNNFDIGETFDRVVSVEMFEHMRNYQTLLANVARWLRPDGKLFVHIFCHRSSPYAFEPTGPADWMSRHFFTGGIMPSADIFERFTTNMRLADQKQWDGTHYEKTANAWLANLDANREQVLSIFETTYGPQEAKRWLQRWRLFFMACAELFGYNDGDEWFVSHYLLEPASKPAAAPLPS